jgi:hypothetical protein
MMAQDYCRSRGWVELEVAGNLMVKESKYETQLAFAWRRIISARNWVADDGDVIACSYIVSRRISVSMI